MEFYRQYFQDSDSEEDVGVNSPEFKMPPIHQVFTDGSYTPTRCGYGIFFGDGDPRNVSKLVTNKKTNNIAELKAILEAIQIMISSPEYNVGNIIEIYSDSDYCIKSILNWADSWEQNGWKTAKNKPVKNKDLIQQIRSFYKSDHRVQLLHVKAHQKPPEDSDRYQIWYGNMMADRLATGK